MIIEPLIGAHVPDMSDGPLGGLQVGNVVRDLVPFVVPRFTNAADRDSKYATWVAAGNTLRDGMACYTTSDSRYWTYKGGWQYLGGAPPATIPWPTTASWAAVPGYTMPGYYKDGSGIVHGSGAVRSTAAIAAGGVFASLPAGYRPASLLPMQLQATTASAALRIDVDVTGAMTVVGGAVSGAIVFLDQLIFTPATLAAAAP